jgi:hypothetical protein
MTWGRSTVRQLRELSLSLTGTRNTRVPVISAKKALPSAPLGTTLPAHYVSNADTPFTICERTVEVS